MTSQRDQLVAVQDRVQLSLRSCTSLLAIAAGSLLYSLELITQVTSSNKIQVSLALRSCS